MSVESLGTLIKTMERSRTKLFYHCSAVANLADRICILLKIENSLRQRTVASALMHDVGKIDISPAILDKPGKLNAEEWSVIKTHPLNGASMVKERGESKLSENIRYHHERWDGKGYEGLSGNQIPLGAQIIALADSLDAMVSRRPYRTPLRLDAALHEIHRNRGTQFNPEIINVLVESAFWQPETYLHPTKLERQIEEEKSRLVQLVQLYAGTHHPLVYAQSQWLDHLLNLLGYYSGFSDTNKSLLRNTTGF